MEEEIVTKTISTKTGVLKRTKKPSKKSSDFPLKTATPESIVKSVEPKVVKSSQHVSFKGGPKKVKKLQFTRSGVLIREVSCPGSSASNKR